MALITFPFKIDRRGKTPYKSFDGKRYSEFPLGNKPEVDPAHGTLRVLSGAGFGTKADYNSGAYTIGGQTHIVARSTDLDKAETQEPASNTQAGWQSHLDGVYPIVTSTDFNSQATASKATVEMAGGPTASGRFLKRVVDQGVEDLFPLNARLRNFNLWPTNVAHSKLYMSCYIMAFDDYGLGKSLRFYWTGGSNINKNVWTGKPLGDLGAPSEQVTARAEASGSDTLGLYSDNAVHPSGQWIRYEIIADFANDTISLYANGVALTDASNGYGEVITGWLGTGGQLDYFLLGNTVDKIKQPHHYLGWARPYMDFSDLRVELTDSATWSIYSANKVIQTPVNDGVSGWTDSRIPFVIDQGHFTDLTGKYIHVVDGKTSIYSEAL